MKYIFLLLLGVVVGYVWAQSSLSLPEQPGTFDAGSVQVQDQPLTEPSSQDVDLQPVVSDKGVSLFVQTPQQNAVIQSPLEITGEAPGSWFFEASFPLVLTDWDGKIIAQGYAQAQEDWMTESLVPFKGVLEFLVPAYGENGFLILRKDNPSGLSEHDDAIEIPLRFVQ